MQVDFYISRSGKAAVLGKAIADILVQAGYKCTTPEDFGSRNFVTSLDDALRSGARVIALLSGDYFQSSHCMAEAYKALALALSRDPQNKSQKLIPLRIEEVRPSGLLANIVYFDLVPLLRTGDNKALVEALHAIIKPQSSVETSKTLDPLRRPSSQLLHPEIRPFQNFMGRRRELDQLSFIFSKSATVAVTGLGGVGKSVLAKQFAYENRQRYRGIWFISAENRSSLIDSLASFASLIIPDAERVVERDKVARLALSYVEKSDAGSPWLLIYDNVPSPSDLEGLTPTVGAHVLITSRWTDWHGHATKLTLDVFSRDDSIAFIQMRASLKDPKGAADLANLLGDLPLALEQAASYCRSRRASFTTYMSRYQDLLGQTPRASQGNSNSVIGTFSIALDEIMEKTPEAVALMEILSFIPIDEVPLELFENDKLSPIQVGEAVAALTEASLVELTYL